MNDNILKTLIIIAVLCCTARNAYGFTVNFEGAAKTPVSIVPPKTTGLSYVYVVDNISDIRSISIVGIDVTEVENVQIYSNLGGGFGQDISYTTDNGNIHINKPAGDMGYIVQTARGSQCFWIVDYADKVFNISSLTMQESQPCDYSEFTVSGNADAIKYYSISGQPVTLDREINVTYNSLKWDDTLKNYEQVAETKKLGYLDHTFTLSPPLFCRTSLVITGDRFLENWNEGVSYESEEFTPNGICVQTIAEQTNKIPEEGSNQINQNGTGLGGSAPADFVFSAYPSEGVIHNEWQIADDPNFEYIKYRFNEKELTYTFYDEGKYYVRFIGSNSDGSCEVFGEEYEIGIGASDLRIPNAFSPDGDGVNDIWKVGYVSLVEFKCWIFDKNGQQLFYFDNPQLGWDGKYKGKTVPAGVYYYVIEAKGADGVKYKRGGDINIINYRKIPNHNN